MIAYGYDKNDEEKNNLCKLSEISLVFKIEEINKMYDFIVKIKNDIGKMSNPNYVGSNHWHYRDFNKDWTNEESDFIVVVEE